MSEDTYFDNGEINNCNIQNPFIEYSSESRGFRLNDAHIFFINRLNQINLTNMNDDILIWEKDIKESIDPLNTYTSIMTDIKTKVDMFNLGHKVDWHHLPSDKSIVDQLYVFRECVVAITFLTTARIFQLTTEI